MADILTICQEISSLICVQKPQDLFNENSETDSLFLCLAKETLASLLAYGSWQESLKEGEFKTRAGKTDYPISDFCDDFYCFENHTMYFKNASDKVIGSVSPNEFMRTRYFSGLGGALKFRIQNGQVRFLTQPPANISVVFSYRSSHIVYTATGEEKSNITQNTDIPVFNHHLVKLGILWRFLKRSGLDYAEEFNEYERELHHYFASSLSQKDICLTPSAVLSSEEILYAD